MKLLKKITTQKMKFSITDFFSKCNRIWSHLLRKSLMENLFFCPMNHSNDQNEDQNMFETLYNK